MLEFPDLSLWMDLLPATLTAVIPTALFTGFLCWLLWGRRLKAARGSGDYFGEPAAPGLAGAAAPGAGVERDRGEAQRIAALEEQIAEREEKAEESRAAVSRTEAALAEARATVENLQTELAQRERDLEQARKEEGGEAGSSAETEVIELTEALRESEYEVSRLGTEIQLLRTIRIEFEALRNDNDALEAELEGLRRDKAALEEAVDPLRAAKGNLEDALNTIRVEKRDLEERIENLTARVETESDRRIHAERELVEWREAREVSPVSPPSDALAVPAPTADAAAAEDADADAAELANLPSDAEDFGQVHESPPKQVDDLTEIEGISAGLASKLNSLGVFQFSQIARWESAQIAAFSERLGFQDRIVRDRWIEQAIQLGTADRGATREAGQASEEAAPEGQDSDGASAAAAEPVPPRAEDAESRGAAGQSLLIFNEFGAPEEGDGEAPSVAEGGPVRWLPDLPETADPDDPDDRALLVEDAALGPVYRRPPSKIDDLTKIKGIARVIEGRLHEIGIFRYRQIAAWTDAQVDLFSKQLSFRDRIERDRWREQCQDLHREKYGERGPIDWTMDTRAS